MFIKEEFLTDLSNTKSLKDLYNLSLKNGKNTVALLEEKDGHGYEITYSKLDTYVKGATRLLIEKIDRPGILALQVPNGSHFAVFFWAILASGHDVLLLDARAPEELVRHLMKETGAVAYVGDKEMEGVQCISPSQLCFHSYEGDVDTEWANGYVLCTSGTTALSRAFYFDGDAICDQFRALTGLLETSDRWGRELVQERSLAFLPFHHVMGFTTVFLLTQVMGNTMVFPKTMAPEEVLDACRKHRVTQLISIPLFWNSVARTVRGRWKMMGKEVEAKLAHALEESLRIQKKHGRAGQEMINKIVMPKLREQLFGNDMQLLCTGGGYIPRESLELFNGLGYYFVNGYGVTETGIISVTSSEDVEKRLEGTVGKPFFEDSVTISPEGEILVEGDYLHKGHFVGGELIPRDKVFVTGDKGEFTADGSLVIRGRSKEIIFNDSGENVYPDEIESYFEGLPSVATLSVIGRKEELYDVVALILFAEKAPGQEELMLLGESIMKRNRTLPVYKQVREVYLSKVAPPLSATMKVKRGKLKEMLENEPDNFLRLDQLLGKAKPEAAPGGHELNKIKRHLKEEFAKVLFLEPDEIPEDAHFILDLGGDSLNSLTLLNEVERHYQIMISDVEYFSCTNVSELSELIYRKLSGEESVKLSITPRGPITSFEESHEYLAFKARMDEEKEVLETYGNPYFVAHESALRDTSVMDGKRVLNFGSYNYLGMSGDPRVNEAAKKAVDQYGTSASGSRLLAGEKPVHKELEAKIAKWKGVEDSLVLVGGHSTNVTFVGNFCREGDLILYDALSHNSITQGCELSTAVSKAFPHNDVAALEEILKLYRRDYEKILIVVEGVYSMDGDIAPVPAFVELKKKYGCFLMVDEAHSACVLGENGGGVQEYFGLKEGDVDIYMGTLSKGLGTCGGYLAGKKTLIDYLRYNIPGFVFSVGISPPLAAATLRALEIMEESNERVAHLHDGISLFVSEAKRRGMDTCLCEESAIIPIMVGEDSVAFKLSMLLLKEGIFVPPAVYPAVPKHQARLRFCLTSEHHAEEILFALDVLERLMRGEGLIEE